MDRYITLQGDVLDKICLDYYGQRQGTVEQVLEANPGLADKGPIYPAGITIMLPVLAKTVQPQPISLWD